MKKSNIKKFILKALSAPLSDIKSLEKIKKEFAIEEKEVFIKNAEINKVYFEMIKKGEVRSNETLRKLLITKKIRTLSGVAVIAVLTKPSSCPGKCIYCPSEKNMPKSYLSNEPAVMRAIKTSFHPYKQVHARMRALSLNGHSTDKLELIVMGGTFSHFPPQYQSWFIKECFRAANDFPRNSLQKKGSVSLEKEKSRNEKAKNRIIGLTLETRQDFITPKELLKFRRFGATRVEIGVQTIFDDVLKKNKRGHLTLATTKATALLKNAGFKVNYHLMPGMYGSNVKKDFMMFKTLFSDERFAPDLIKIYPCVVTNNSELFSLWRQGKYTPLTNSQNKQLLKKIKPIIPQYTRITRLIRDIPEESIIAGPNISNMRQILQQEKVHCECIRCREVRDDFTKKDKIILDRIDYKASKGKEIFLQYVSPNKMKLYAMLRLRIPPKNNPLETIIPALSGSALIREVHTFGKLAKIDKTDSSSPQHIGLGRKLLQKAESISKEEFGFEKIAIISGVGVREYYKKFDYKLENEYMTKKL
ncbi:tRNA uridine(34) 5-carboxymethylaminomethyl modification radical SAM/GNAT enzyme Elp3 [bacterium]|jgi:elongator complex protein 3|nr:tRNA uridine(34) 5-carboxymethylaminomethyl modification radical SAM/GNAT enzyme Elp3 [bacterium]MBT4251320.1 tRNA uridine(34) 5-carboxymethylaminomethyl modification radical SAM/GNAT enzyme Elp3 [bacterium]MBT4598299.1 tRNA uridine(34) 5-carboxymethylaminomethyl modification radical SAM/GNAT enzyme Elp3 [bacterium]MBT6754132.1 tRNA uridine(34) 5-carboxymethylaminomethyl modification radical SAM/GNAT enzyme Elp3 [bacterium]MBT7037952.1 tRNA uridine(34) 5-carboxymethylaminomethyl modification